MMNSQYKTYFFAKRQQGVVLFVALIALVVMSLAAVALIRSVDTSTLIAGNLASKQAATASADSGMETALTWMEGITNLTALEVDSPANAALGYYTTPTIDPTTLAWDATDSRPASDAGGNIDANGTELDGGRNTIRYVIQRMCRISGAPLDTTCMFGAPVVGNSSSSVKDAPSAGAIVAKEQSPVYRITSRVVGAKNTISYIQAFVY